MLVLGIISVVVVVILLILLLVISRQLSFTKEKLKVANDSIERLKLDYEHQLDLALKESQYQRENFAVKLNAQKDTFEAEKANWELTKKSFENSRVEDKALTAIQIKALKEEFSVLSAKLLDEKQQKLTAVNEEKLTALLDPLKVKMSEFKAAVELAQKEDLKLNTQLSEQIKNMIQETNRIGGEAQKLAEALKGNSKVQGDWGEMVLESILQKSGLKKDIHYEVQATLRSSTGRTIKNDDDARLKPDCIVHYPDSRDIIVDSKVSISAYVDYCNSDNEEAKAEALARHIQSIEKHIKELAEKDYPSFANKARETVDFTLMFIPNEASWQLAIMAKPELWDEAWKKRILITGPTNLMVFLKIIYITWNRNEQTKNQQKIMETAGQLLERLQSFYKSFDELGEQIEKTSKNYQDTLHRLISNGRNHSVISSGERLLALGAKPKKTMVTPARFHLHSDVSIFDSSIGDKVSAIEDFDNDNISNELLTLADDTTESIFNNPNNNQEE